MVYHLEYEDKRTRDYQVKVFDYRRLERANADVHYPEYTGMETKSFENTRRISAVEGSKISFQLQFNKAIAQASLVSKGTNRHILKLSITTNHPSATLDNFPLNASRTYDLQLIDHDGRTNKVPGQFVFDALKNRTPELKVTSPRGDTRPSPLEELSFDGTVFDDFGVLSFGLASAVAGKEIKLIELGRTVPGKQKQAFHYLLRLEELNLQTDDLMSWFLWADDVGPDGKLRRTTGDLFFADVRPFEEIFREGLLRMGYGGTHRRQARCFVGFRAGAGRLLFGYL